MLDERLASVMQRILAEESERFILTGTLKRLAENGIGTIRGKSLYINARDRAEIREWLIAKGFATEKVHLGSMDRVSRLDHTPYEKSGGGSVKAGNVFLKALPGKQLRIGENPLDLPAGSCLGIDGARIARNMRHNCIMVVENYTCFRDLHKATFKLPDGLDNPVVVYRGDSGDSRIDDVQQFVADTHLPVLAFVDLDPAGLVIASGFARLAAVILPEEDKLDQLLDSPKHRRLDLYASQYPEFGAALDALPAGGLMGRIWAKVKSKRACLVQEGWMRPQLPCIAWG